MYVCVCIKYVYYVCLCTCASFVKFKTINRNINLIIKVYICEQFDFIKKLPVHEIVIHFFRIDNILIFM